MTEQDAGKIVLSDRPQEFIELIRSNLMMREGQLSVDKKSTVWRTRPLIHLKNRVINKVPRQMTNTASHCKISGLALIVADNLFSRKIVTCHITTKIELVIFGNQSVILRCSQCSHVMGSFSCCSPHSLVPSLRNKK